MLKKRFPVQAAADLFKDVIQINEGLEASRPSLYILED
jgi:hypothetical protein